MAVAHTILVLVYHLLKTTQSYHELGADYLDQFNAEYLKWSLLERLARLGVQMTVHSTDPLVSLPGEGAIFEGEPPELSACGT